MKCAFAFLIFVNVINVGKFLYVNDAGFEYLNLLGCVVFGMYISEHWLSN